MQGEILNKKYQIDTLLSKKGARETFLARDLDSQELVVVKLLKFGLDSEWEDFKLFEREAKILQNLNLAAIPKYIDYFELDLPHSKGFSLVQNYIDAPSLVNSLKSGRSFSELEIKQIAEAMLDILIYLHQRQPAIIHRDIKPSNVLLSNRSGNSVGNVYLVDFGAVKNVASTEGGTITIVGTYGYMPPEQFGGYTTPASDLYSLGATLIYLATGRHPTELPSKDGKIIFADSVQLNRSFIQWLEKMIEPSQDRRFGSATEALQVLKHPLANIQSELKLVKQPKLSRMVLQKTPKAIEVLIPPAGFSAQLPFVILFALFWNGFLVVWTGISLLTPFPINILFGLFSIPFWTVGLGFIGTILFSFWGRTKLKITNQQISLTHECWGIKYQEPKATNRQDITVVELTGTQWRIDGEGDKIQIPSAVVIWANDREYSIRTTVKNKTVGGRTISNYNPETMELNWLAQELSQWLNIPLIQNKYKQS